MSNDIEPIAGSAQHSPADPMEVIDAFMAFFARESAERFENDTLLRGVRQLFRDTPTAGPGLTVDGVLDLMDRAGIGRGIATGELVGGGLMGGDRGRTERMLAVCETHSHRLRAALTVDRIPSIREVCARIEQYVQHPMVVAVRVVPLLQQEPINSRIYYPIYERCEALGLPVTINVGVPGPKVRAAHQHPLLLDDVLIDFPDLVVVGAHMGHPWEEILISLMMKYDNLHLCTSAYLAKYMDQNVVRFMDSSRGRTKIVFASDFPLLPFDRAIEEARRLPISADSMRAFLGDNAQRLFWA